MSDPSCTDEILSLRLILEHLDRQLPVFYFISFEMAFGCVGRDILCKLHEILDKVINLICLVYKAFNVTSYL